MIDNESTKNEKSAWKSPTCIQDNNGAVTAWLLESCEKKINSATIKEAKILPGAKKVVILFDKLLPNKAMMVKLTNGNKGIRYTKCSIFSLQYAVYSLQSNIYNSFKLFFIL